MRTSIYCARRAPSLARIIPTLAIAGLLVVLPTPAFTQATRPCLPFDPTAAAVSEFAVTIVSDTSRNARAFRTQHGVPTGSAADVAREQDNAVCEAATASLEAKGAPHLSEAVVVVRIGQVSPYFYLLTRREAVGILSVFLVNDRFVYLAEFAGDERASAQP
jgi:hypothetical protein